MATGSQVGTVCGLYLRESTKSRPAFVAGGFVREFATRLLRACGTEPLRLEAGIWVLPFSTPVFGAVADAVLRESGAVTLALHTTVSEVRTEGPRVVEVRSLAWNESLGVRPRVVVDCTGEATVAGLAGAGIETGASDQAPALVFSLADVESAQTECGLLEVRRELRRAVASGVLPAVCERLALIPGTNRDGRMDLKLNLAPADSERPLWKQVTSWERDTRALVLELHRFLVQNTATCRRARLTSVAPQLGVRSGRRIQGRAELADEDVLLARKSPLGVARGCWPMERWIKVGRPEMSYFDEGDYYEVALDCLRTAKPDNLFAAGRCFGAGAGAMSSARVVGTALATGWAAGTAAAFQAAGRPLDEAVETVRRQANEGAAP